MEAFLQYFYFIHKTLFKHKWKKLLNIFLPPPFTKTRKDLYFKTCITEFQVFCNRNCTYIRHVKMVIGHKFDIVLAYEETWEKECKLFYNPSPHT